MAFAARLARFAASLALRVSCCAKPAAARFSSMGTLRRCRALLRSSFRFFLPYARSRVQAAWPSMTPDYVSSRLAPRHGRRGRL
eukprot:1949927-Pleurochrysis_carterae.AAC.2